MTRYRHRLLKCTSRWVGGKSRNGPVWRIRHPVSAGEPACTRPRTLDSLEERDRDASAPIASHQLMAFHTMLQIGFWIVVGLVIALTVAGAVTERHRHP